ncbi:MAG: HNH endonuclease [Muribaculaceae bacterium]|nr:HNH endonuclease [Muribaculaceae bacterium]
MVEIYAYYGSYMIRSSRHDVYVSNYGNVLDNGKKRKNPTKALGDRIYVAVAKLFVPNPEGKPQVDHIDTDRKNNRADNLRWVTNQENMLNPTTREHCSHAAKKRWADGIYVNAVEKAKGRPSWNKGIKGAGNSMYGKHHTERSKALISLQNKGRKKVWDDDSHTSYHLAKPCYDATKEYKDA